MFYSLDPLYFTIFRVVSEDLISVDDENNTIDLTFTPTIPHCSMATLIGLTIRVKLIRSLPSRFKVSVKITEGSHSQVDSAINLYRHILNKKIQNVGRHPTFSQKLANILVLRVVLYGGVTVLSGNGCERDRVTFDESLFCPDREQDIFRGIVHPFFNSLCSGFLTTFFI